VADSPESRRLPVIRAGRAVKGQHKDQRTVDPQEGKKNPGCLRQRRTRGVPSHSIATVAYHQVEPPHTLSTLLSVERMGTFTRIAQEEGNVALELYVLDVELASAFMADLALLEVALRNTMNDQLTDKLGLEWFQKDNLLDERSRSAIKRAWKDGKCKRSMPPGKLIAQLTLGFWVGLLDAGGPADQPPHDAKRNYEMSLWRPCLRFAFPNGSGRRSTQHELARRVQVLRNRVAHHEPIIGGILLPGTGVRRALPEAHQDILDLMYTIDVDLFTWMTDNSGVPSLLENLGRQAKGLPRAP
jgi:hypothetical protein